MSIKKYIIYGIIGIYGVTFVLWGTRSGHYEDHSAVEENKYTKPKKTKEKMRKRLKGGYFACTTDVLFHEVTAAVVQKDNLAIEHLLKTGCILTKAGARVSIIDFGIGTTKVRAYTGDGPMILYTNTENIFY